MEATITPTKVSLPNTTPINHVGSDGSNSSSSVPPSTSTGSDRLHNVSPIICTVLWISLGISMIMFNKIILAPVAEGGWNFQYPFFLTMLHQIFATIFTQILHRYTPLLHGVKSGQLTSDSLYKKVTPLAFFFSLGLVLGNSAYKYLSVSYIQMIKSCLPIPTLTVAYLLGREDITMIQIVLVLIICSGAMIASFGELHFSILGFILQSSALLADVFRMLFLDLLTINVKLDNLSTIYYMAPMSAIMIMIGFFLFEYNTFHPYEYEVLMPIENSPLASPAELTTNSPISHAYSSDMSDRNGLIITHVPYPNYFWFILLGNSFLAFALNLSIVLFVSNVGIMAMTLAGILKDVTVVAISALIFGMYS